VLRTDVDSGVDPALVLAKFNQDLEGIMANLKDVGITSFLTALF